MGGCEPRIEVIVKIQTKISRGPYPEGMVGVRGRGTGCGIGIGVRGCESRIEDIVKRA